MECITTFQSDTFVMGMVTGCGICVFTLLITCFICSWKRRKRQEHINRIKSPGGQSESHYENSLTLNELNSTPSSSPCRGQENTQEVHAFVENDSVQDTRQMSVDGENISTIETNARKEGDNNKYSNLNLFKEQHIYKAKPLIDVNIYQR